MSDETGCRLYLLWFVRFMKGLTILSLLATVAAYIIIIKYGVQADSLSNVDKAFSVLGNAGFIALSIVLIIAEFEPEWFIRKCMIMHYWAGRGSWILWMGVQCISASKQLYAAVKEDKNVNADLLENFGTVVGSIMIGCGTIYIIFTFLCVKSFSEMPELDAPLMGGGAADASDAILAANLAVALGMTPADAKKRFAKNGAKEAQKMAKERAEEMATLQAKLNKAAQAGANTGRALASEASKTYNGAAEAASNAAASAGSYAPPPRAERSAAADDDNPRAKRADDEDELLKAYYGGK